MAHPLVRLVATRPQMLAEHLSAYAELLAEEAAATTTQLKRTLAFLLVGGCCVSIAIVLIGTALMLWAAQPAGSLHVPWLLIVVPAIPTAIGIGTLIAGAQSAPDDLFATVRQQLCADAEVLDRINASIERSSEA